ncbi:hypothetical protein LJK88_27915 [Paenibacillus sp. P26]|nr:hypothetical protein LJK88_27915 [Paenibacillus sp. P26]
MRFPRYAAESVKAAGDGRDSWPARQIERCIKGLSHECFQTHIDTDHMTTEQVVEQIAALSAVPLVPDRRGKLGRARDRILTQIKHIRFF